MLFSILDFLCPELTFYNYCFSVSFSYWWPYDIHCGVSIIGFYLFFLWFGTRSCLFFFLLSLSPALCYAYIDRGIHTTRTTRHRRWRFDFHNWMLRQYFHWPFLFFCVILFEYTILFKIFFVCFLLIFYTHCVALNWDTIWRDINYQLLHPSFLDVPRYSAMSNIPF